MFLQYLQNNFLQFSPSTKQVGHKHISAHIGFHQSSLVPYLSMDFTSSYPWNLLVLNQTLLFLPLTLAWECTKKKNTKPGLVEYFCKELKMSFVFLSKGISCSDAGSVFSKLALRYPLGTIVNPLLLILTCSHIAWHNDSCPRKKPTPLPPLAPL